MENPILIISTSVDLATDVVTDELRRREVPFVRLDTDNYPYEIPVAVLCGSDGLAFHIDGKQVLPRTIWYRRLRAPTKPDAMDVGIHDYCVREAQAAIQGIGLSLCPRIMSAPAAVFAAENKILQLTVAMSVGLQIPDTCVANDPTSVRRFVERHDRVVCKPLRSGWFHDASGQWSIYTTEVESAMLAHIDEVQRAPSIFQPLVEKACDVRITVVGERFFVAEIESQLDEAARVDWRRTKDPNLPHRRAILPNEVEVKLRNLMQKLDLRFGAIDMIRTPSGQYVFLEVNANGQWLWLDEQLGLGITLAVADWLTGTQA